MTESQELFFKAGKYAGKAETYRYLRANTAPINPKWNEYDEASKRWHAKYKRFLNRAEEVAGDEADEIYQAGYDEGQTD